MATPTGAIHTLDAYQLRLPVFEGPLDVLLRLIERDQLEISEVSLLVVFDQFLAFTRALESPSPALVAEFAAVAGRLSVLKSRALLPKAPRLEDEPDETDLVRQLEEYRAVKAAARLLAERQLTGSGAFGRGEGVAFPDAPPAPTVPQSPRVLHDAVTRWLTRIPRRTIDIPALRAVSLREMIDRITSQLARRREAPFAVILAKCRGRQDVTVAFMALLVLVRRQAVVASQTELFGSILMSWADRPRTSQLRSLPAIWSETDG